MTDIKSMTMEELTHTLREMGQPAFRGGQGFTWLDAGTHESLTDATNFVKTVETHQHRKIGCLEEIAYLNGWISRNALLEVCEKYRQNQYGQYLHDVAEGKFRENLF